MPTAAHHVDSAARGSSPRAALFLARGALSPVCDFAPFQFRLRHAQDVPERVTEATTSGGAFLALALP
jgi:hypothetical protein